MRRLVRAPMLAVFVAVALIASACTHSRTTAGPEVHAAPTFSPVTESQTVRLLAAAGVGTVVDETSKTPLVPVSGAPVLMVTAWQAANMTEQVNDHGGILGADLAAMLPIPTGPTLAQFIAAWLLGAGTPSARAAAALLGPVDFAQVNQLPFPAEVLELFVADATRAATTGAASPTPAASPDASSTSASSTTHATDAEPAVEPAAFALADPVLDTPCTSIAGFVTNILDGLFNALKINESDVANYVSGATGGGLLGSIFGTAAGWLASLYNGFVEGLHVTLRTVLDQLTKPVMNALRLAIGGLALVTTIASYLKQWTATVTPDPAENTVSANGNPGTVTVSIANNDRSDDWPPQIVDCARYSNVTLPTLTKAGEPDLWTVRADPSLLTVDKPAGPPYRGVLNTDIQDVLSYTTGKQDPSAKNGTLVHTPVWVGVTVTRTELQQLSDFVKGFMTDQIPSVIRPILSPLVSDLVSYATDRLNDIVGVSGSSTILISHRIPKPPKPTPSSSCADSGHTVPAGSYRGRITATITTTMHLTTGGVSIPDAGGGSLPLTGSVTVTSNGSSVTGTMTLHGSGTSHVGLPGEVNVHSSSSGSFTGRISGPASGPVVDGTLSGEWASLDAPLGNSSGSASNAVHAGLHLTKTSCASISGDVVALFGDFAAPVAQYITVGGTGRWTATRS